MSEVVRSISRSERLVQPSASSGGSRRIRIAPWILLLLVASGIYIWWVSRDSHEIRPFISNNPAAVIVVHDAFLNRDSVFGSPAWLALPEDARQHPVPSMFAVNFDAPDWVLRNLFGRHVLAVAPGEGDFEDAIYISKMSRFGVIIERALRRTSGNTLDVAGGLKLRLLAVDGIYYAVRGRLLIAGTSRRALIRTLTLDDAERVAPEDWDESIWDAGSEDVRGTFRLGDDSRWSEYFAGIGFALRVEPEQAVLKLKMPCTDAFYDEFIPSLAGTGPTPLYMPESGTIQFAADIGATYESTFQILERVLEADSDAEEPWLVGLLERNTPTESAKLLQSTGTSIARTWHGYALGDIVPAHTTSTIVRNIGEAVAQAMSEASTDVPANFEPMTRRRNTDNDWLEISSIGGPSLTEVIVLNASQQTVFATSSINQAELNGWSGSASASTLDQPGNLYVRINPGAVLTEYEARIAELEAGFGITSEQALEYGNQIALRRDQVRSIREIELTAEHDPQTRTIQATLTIR